MLFEPSRHERLLPIQWDEDRVRSVIGRIASDAEQHFTKERRWPLHPLDLDAGDDPNGGQSTYLDAVHGFVATAGALIRGRHVLDPESWAAWERSIATTVERSATRDGRFVNWRPQLDAPKGMQKFLMQYCHGACPCPRLRHAWDRPNGSGGAAPRSDAIFPLDR